MYKAGSWGSAGTGGHPAAAENDGGGGGFTPSGRANMSVKQMIATHDKKRFLKNLVINCEAFLKCMYNNGA